MHLGKHGLVVFTGKHKRVDELINSFRSRRVAIQKSIKKADFDKNMQDLIEAYESMIFHPSVPHEMAWGRRAGVYHGGHIVRKLVLVHYHQEHTQWKWNSRSDILKFGPDKCEYLKTVPAEWAATKIRSVFWPVDPSRLSMWACLVGLAFKKNKPARQACAQGRFIVDLFAASAEALKAEFGDIPHVENVLKRMISKLPAP